MHVTSDDVHTVFMLTEHRIVGLTSCRITCISNLEWSLILIKNLFLRHKLEIYRVTQ